VIRVAPGVYTEATGIALEDYVNIEGSGQGITTLTATSAATQATTVRATGTLHAEIRDLTISNTGGGSTAIALAVTNTVPAGGLRISDTTLTATGAASTRGVTISNSSPTVAAVTASATSTTGAGYAMGIEVAAGSAPTIRDTVITAASSGLVTGQFGLRIDSSSASTDNVTANAVGINSAQAISLSGATGVIRNVTANSAWAGVGIYASTVTLENVTTTATTVLGVYVVIGPASVVNVVGSDIAGTNSSVLIGAIGSTVTVTNSVLRTPEDALVSCTFTVDGAGVALNATCD
jgi:hypothetical protein